MMEMTKQRKVLIGVLCLGLGGLVVDRLVIGLPDEASASESDAVAVVAQAPPAFESSAPAVSEPEQTVAADINDAVESLPSYAALSERLLAARQHARSEAAPREDPFTLPAQWQAARANTITQPQEENGTEHFTRFNSLFKLDGTVRSNINGEDELLAVISGAGLDSRAIRIGQALRLPNEDGVDETFQLVEVGSRVAVWEVVSTGERIEIQVEEDL